MLAELRTKSQITIPKDIVTRLGLSEGDKLEITENDGIISIIPVVVYPKKYVDNLRKEVNDVKSNIKFGKAPVFDNIDLLFEKLEKN